MTISGENFNPANNDIKDVDELVLKLLKKQKALKRH